MSADAVLLDGVAVDLGARRVRALDGVDLRIGAGERVALLGASGAGKTTLLRLLLGAVPPAAGRVQVTGVRLWEGTPATQARARRTVRRRCGTVRQGGDLIATVSARLNAVAGTAPSWGARDWLAVASGRAPRRHAGRLAALARDHGLDGLLDVRVAELSGGQRQRVALLRALLPEPALLLADEPTAGLDVVTAAAAVDALLASPAATVVVATHDLDVARRFPRVVALRAGRLVHDGPRLDDDAVAAVYGRAPADPR